MSEKESCPICGAYGSWIYRGENCEAGCTAEMRAEVNRIRQKVGDEKLCAELESMTIRAVTAENKVKLMEYRVLNAAQMTQTAIDFLNGGRDDGQDPWG